MLTPRPYQQAAHDACIDWWRKSTEPCVIEAATGAGKSVIIAMLAKTLHGLSGSKRVLCLQPSKELTEQNAEKYTAIGAPCSIYSASIGKSLRHQVIFATEGTFKSVAKRLGHEFAGVIVDECHRITPTIKRIIADMREGNQNLRVCGLSATPYRLGDGFVFRYGTNGQPVSETKTKEPYFARLVYSICARSLIEQGFLTPVVARDINATGYDTSGLVLASNGRFSSASVEQAFEGWGRETSRIIADVVENSRDRRGVMIFGATIKHCHEIMASLPVGLSAMVTGETKMHERERIIRDYKAQRIKYLANVSVLTTGFDSTHTDLVVLMRATESISLMQQMMGRGMRLCEGKTECILLDYAGNIERHCPDGDLYRPEIKANHKGGGGEMIEAQCPECENVNKFAQRENEGGFEIDRNGYFIDLDGERILTNDDQPMPAHYGRRCLFSAIVKGKLVQCEYRWTFKECPACNHENDIAARYCKQCREELVNPNERLIAVHAQLKKDPTKPQCDAVLSMVVTHTISKAGNPMIRVEIHTEARLFSVYYQTAAPSSWLANQYETFMRNTNGGQDTPRTIGYRKEGDFYRITSYNQPTDKETLEHALSRLANGSGRQELPGRLPNGAGGANNAGAENQAVLA